ncbi:hypothetical protein BP5796_11077 [Coleophoma crateriformis]|uniref:Uncharacterized protein n=1 Tax=Coleophoma crateriformis TaxID=565419 RepID=A0A3D8QLV4_9HELO|nr:hypothetical protein BP5796_11077 [Coleophoma crateriformis]
MQLDHKADLVALAGNDKIVSYENGTLKQYDSMQAYLSKDSVEIGACKDVISLVANQTSFTALTSNGEVWTWGDARYEACLGREVCDESPPAKPHLVEDLLDLPSGPIVKISSGGYATAAVTEAHDLYVWGGRTGQSKLVEGLSGQPIPIDLDGRDFLDVAVGNDHMVALTTDHELFVVGAGGNGQLGTYLDKLEDWKEVKLNLGHGRRMTGIYAGYKTTFVLVEGPGPDDNT